MKRNGFTIALVALGVAVLALPAWAATTVSFSPASVSTTQGKSFNVTVTVNPQGVSNYTEKIELNYPADILQVNSFSFASNWMALSQSGYDLVDNANGVLIKTAGYPGGLSSAVTFGTVSFYAKKAGSGTIKVGSGALALDANNQNVLSGTPGVSVVVAAPANVPLTPAVGAPATAPVAPVPTPQPVAVPIPQPAPQASLLAAVGSALTLGTGNVWLGILVGLIILAIVIYAVFLFTRKGRKDLG